MFVHFWANAKLVVCSIPTTSPCWDIWDIWDDDMNWIIFASVPLWYPCCTLLWFLKWHGKMQYPVYVYCIYIYVYTYYIYIYIYIYIYMIFQLQVVPFHLGSGSLRVWSCIINIKSSNIIPLSSIIKKHTTPSKRPRLSKQPQALFLAHPMPVCSSVWRLGCIHPSRNFLATSSFWYLLS